MSSVSTISHEERLLPQCFPANYVVIKMFYTSPLFLIPVLLIVFVTVTVRLLPVYS